MPAELVIATNPDPDSRLPYLLWVPLEDGLVFRVKDTWPRTSAVYCHPVGRDEWPTTPQVVERVPLQVCRRRGAAIDLVADRAREQRSQLVFTTARGRDAVFWQAPRTRKKARPQVRTPTARASGLAELEIVVDTRERYPWRFPTQQVTTVSRALPVGDYGVVVGGRLVAAVERKTVADLLARLTDGTLRHAAAELSALPRAAIVVEDAYAAVFRSEHVRPAVVADGLAELQVRVPEVPVMFSGARKLAEEWTYRFLGAAAVWAAEEGHAIERIGAGHDEVAAAPLAPEPSAAELRAWARASGYEVSDRGRIAREIREAWDHHHRPSAG
ncbi:hypothetical protein FTX61_06295 [Nitriliruptoraceae bacterium ZYF776]|nr:hypothetical protein [Profundirhabdus halotolerans]